MTKQELKALDKSIAKRNREHGNKSRLFDSFAFDEVFGVLSMLFISGGLAVYFVIEFFKGLF